VWGAEGRGRGGAGGGGGAGVMGFPRAGARA